MDLLSDDEDVGNLSINKKFAEKFDRESRYKELQRSAELGLLGDDDDSDGEADEDSDDEEDDDAVALSSSLDKQIIRTINSIRKKDPKIYDKTATWFDDGNDDEDNEDEDKDTTSSGKRKFKDVLRDQLLKKVAEDGEDDSDDNDDREMKKTRSHGRTSQLAYDAEQSKIRDSILKTIHASGDEDEDEDETGGMLTRVEKHSGEEDFELQAELDEMKRLGKCGLSDPTQDDFLFEYISKQKWKDKTAVVDSSALDEDEDEEYLEETDRFESKYNFRFEETENSGAGQIVGHARTAVDSVRRPDTKRKEQREKRAEKKEKERRQKEIELRRLKNLKRLELEERLKKIGETGGLKDLGIDADVLDEEWDEARHEELMRKQFGDEYYEGQDDDPTFAAEAEGGFDGGDFGGGMYGDEEYGVEEEEEVPKRSKSSISGNPLDELYQLDYEDIVAGIPTRFKYRQVDPEGFGLSADEILLAEDKELNKFIGLKKLATYRQERVDPSKLSKKRKRLRTNLREMLQDTPKGVKASALVETKVVVDVPVELCEEGKKRKRNRRKKTADVVTFDE